MLLDSMETLRMKCVEPISVQSVVPKPIEHTDDLD